MPVYTGRFEKRIVTDISYNSSIYEELAESGFRRVENWMYRPACDNCNACKSYRVIIEEFKLTKSLKRIVNNLNNINIKIIKIPPLMSIISYLKNINLRDILVDRCPK